MPDYQLKIDDEYNISIRNVTKLVPNFFDKEKYILHYKHLQLYSRVELKIKNVNCVLEFDQSKNLKPSIKFNSQKKNRSRKEY